MSPHRGPDAALDRHRESIGREVSSCPSFLSGAPSWANRHCDPDCDPGRGHDVEPSRRHSTPDIVPPEVLVTATYPGADAKTLSQAVSTPIEQQMKRRRQHALHMDSVSANNGIVQLFVDFDVKTDPNTDQVLAQLRVDQAESQLPAQVTTAGLTVQKALTSPLMLVAVTSPGGKLSQDFLTNYAIINLQDQITRIKGVSRVQTFGGQYALRIWVQPDKMAQLGVTRS